MFYGEYGRTMNKIFEEAPEVAKNQFNEALEQLDTARRMLDRAAGTLHEAGFIWQAAAIRAAIAHGVRAYNIEMVINHVMANHRDIKPDFLS